MEVNQGPSLDMGVDELDTAITSAISTPPSDAMNSGAAWFSTQQPKFQEDPPNVLYSDDGNDKVKNLQRYFKNPTEALKSLLGDDFYDGKIDGKINGKVESIAYLIEEILSEILETEDVRDKVLDTSPEDIDQAIVTALNYYNCKKISLARDRDENYYKLFKKIILK